MRVSINEATPIAGWFKMEHPLQNMDDNWGYTHFRKPPYETMGLTWLKKGSVTSHIHSNRSWLLSSRLEAPAAHACKRRSNIPFFGRNTIRIFRILQTIKP
jgi:hypothetical protein